MMMTGSDGDYSADIRALERILLRMSMEDAPTSLQSVENECDVYLDVQPLGAWLIKYRNSGIIFNNCDIIFPKMEIDAKIVFNHYHHFWSTVNSNGNVAIEELVHAFDKGHVMREGSEGAINLFYHSFARALSVSHMNINANISGSCGNIVSANTSVSGTVGGSNNNNTSTNNSSVVSQIRSPLSRKGAAGNMSNSSSLVWDANNINNNSTITTTNNSLLNQQQSSVQANSSISVTNQQHQQSSQSTLLLKQGFLFKKRDVFNGWRQRYCKLYYGRLEYFVNENDAVPRGVIDLYESRVYLPTYQTVSIAGTDHWAIIIEPKSWLEKLRLASTATDSMSGRSEAVQWEQCFTQAASRPYGSSSNGVNSSSIIASYVVGGSNSTSNSLHRSVAALNEGGSGSSKGSSLPHSQQLQQQPWQVRGTSVNKASRANGGIQKSQARTGAKALIKENTVTAGSNTKKATTTAPATATATSGVGGGSFKKWKIVSKGLAVVTMVTGLTALLWFLRIRQRMSVTLTTLIMLLLLLLMVGMHFAYKQYKKYQQSKNNKLASTSSTTSGYSQQQARGTGSRSDTIIETKGGSKSSGSNINNNRSSTDNSLLNLHSNNDCVTTAKETKRSLILPTSAVVTTNSASSNVVTAHPSLIATSTITSNNTTTTHTVTSSVRAVVGDSPHTSMTAATTVTTTSTSKNVVKTATGDGSSGERSYQECDAVSSDGGSSYTNTPTTSDRPDMLQSQQHGLVAIANNNNTITSPHPPTGTGSQPNSPKEKKLLLSNAKTAGNSNNNSGNMIVSFGKRAVTFTVPGSGTGGSGNVSSSSSAGVVNNLLSFRNPSSSSSSAPSVLTATSPRDDSSSATPSTSPRPPFGGVGTDIGSSPIVSNTLLERGSVSLTSSPAKPSILASSLVPLPLGAKLLSTSQTSSLSSPTIGTVQQPLVTSDVSRSSVTSSLDRSTIYPNHHQHPNAAVGGGSAGNNGSRRQKLSNSIQAIFKIKPQQSSNTSAGGGVLSNSPNTHPRSLIESPSLEKSMSSSVDIIDFDNHDVTTEDIVAVDDDTITTGHHHMSGINHNGNNKTSLSTAAAIEDRKLLLRSSSFGSKFKFNFNKNANNNNSTTGGGNNTVKSYAKGLGNGIRNVAVAGGGMIRMERAQSSRVISMNRGRERSESIDSATLDNTTPSSIGGSGTLQWQQQDSEYDTSDTIHPHTNTVPPLRQSSSRRRKSMSALSSASSSYSSDSSNLANY